MTSLRSTTLFMTGEDTARLVIPNTAAHAVGYNCIAPPALIERVDVEYYISIPLGMRWSFYIFEYVLLDSQV